MGMLVMGIGVVVVMVLQRRIRDHGVESRSVGDKVADYSCHVIVSQDAGRWSRCAVVGCRAGGQRCYLQMSNVLKIGRGQLALGLSRRRRRQRRRRCRQANREVGKGRRGAKGREDVVIDRCVAVETKGQRRREKNAKETRINRPRKQADRGRGRNVGELGGVGVERWEERGGKRRSGTRGVDEEWTRWLWVQMVEAD